MLWNKRSKHSVRCEREEVSSGAPCSVPFHLFLSTQPVRCMMYSGSKPPNLSSLIYLITDHVNSTKILEFIFYIIK